MKETLTRRTLLGRAGLALGGAVTLGALQACGSDSSATPAPETVPTPQVNDFPYAKHLSATYQLGAAAVQESAYHEYYNGGCCHGAYYGLMKHLADTAGAPFNLLPLDFGKFGGGGIASYGSICGSLLGSVLVINSIVPDVAAPAGTAAADLPKYSVRSRMMTELMRWYESFSFPAYQPVAQDSHETEASLTRAFNDSGKLPVVQVAPRSHLCHASVTGWCTANGNVSAGGADKKARCARLTADVAGHAAAMLNEYLSTGAFSLTGTPNPNTGCTGCHAPSPAATTPARAPVAAGMECNTCDPVGSAAANDWVHPLSSTHTGGQNPSECDSCH